MEAYSLLPGLTDDVAMECLLRVPYRYHSQMAFVCRSWKSLISSSSFYKERQRLSFAEHLLCLVQPLPTTHIHTLEPIPSSDLVTQQQPSYGLTIYNATKQTWRPVSNQSSAFQVPMFCHCVALPLSNKLVLLGGWDPQTLQPVSTVYVFNFVTHCLAQAASMSKARSFFACAAVGDSRVYVAGGHDSQKNALKSAEVYDAEKDEWTTLPDMDQERDECHGMSWREESKFWVVSGYGTECQGRFRRDVECYDPGTNSWSTVQNVWPFATLSPRCTAAVNGSSRHEWHWFIAREQLHGMDLGEESEEWDVQRSVVQVPEGLRGSSLLSVVSSGLDAGGCDQVFVMGGSSNRPGQVSSSTSNDSGASPCCDGEGAFSLGRDKKWRHVHTPSGFSGFPYSASYLVI
ncbi:hypothetical protein QQ045_028414 [Rhodiola kirilowii]